MAGDAGVRGACPGAAGEGAWSAEGTNRAAGAFLDGFFGQLAALGVRDVVASPGSRSTPLAMKAYEHFGDVLLDIDERGAGFLALGIAKASGRPVAVVATSGTAIGNWMPAVLEAESSHVPVLFFSSDRPARLQGVGAPQTCDQTEIFGGHVRLFRQMPDPNAVAQRAGFKATDELPETLAGQLARAGAEAAREAVAAARGNAQTGPRGPVHLNFPFDEPLKPAPRVALLQEAASSGRTRRWASQKGQASAGLGTVPFPTRGRDARACSRETETRKLREAAKRQDTVPDAAPSSATCENGWVGNRRNMPIPAQASFGRLSGTVPMPQESAPCDMGEAARLVHAGRCIVVAGEGAAETPAEAAAIFEAAAALDLPILADPLSGLRRPEGATVIASYDSVCTRDTQPPIGAVIRLGRWPVSKRLALAVTAARPAHISVDRHEPLDFTGTSTLDVRANPASFLAALAGQLAGRHDRPEPNPEQASFLRQWLAADIAAETRIAAVRTEADPRFEGSYVRALLDAAPAGSLLVAANSMAIRALDTFMFRQDLRVLANRGLNGIDGTTSTALGAALAHARAALAHARAAESPGGAAKDETGQNPADAGTDGTCCAAASPENPASAGNAASPAGRAHPAATYLAGDLTLLHDLTALALAPELARHGHGAPIAIVCLNNSGGAIFDMLPQRAPDPYFKRLFLTPQRLDLRAAAAAFALPYAAPRNPAAFASAYRQALDTPGITLIDVALPLAGMPERYARYW